MTIADGSVHAGEEGEALLNLHGQRFPELVNIGDDLLHRFLVEVEGAGDVVEDADVVHDQAVRLLLAADAVGAADGLQEIVVFHRLVEIHHL